MLCDVLRIFAMLTTLINHVTHGFHSYRKEMTFKQAHVASAPVCLSKKRKARPPGVAVRSALRDAVRRPRMVFALLHRRVRPHETASSTIADGQNGSTVNVWKLNEKHIFVPSLLVRSLRYKSNYLPWIESQWGQHCKTIVRNMHTVETQLQDAGSWRRMYCHRPWWWCETWRRGLHTREREWVQEGVSLHAIVLYTQSSLSMLIVHSDSMKWYHMNIWYHWDFFWSMCCDHIVCWQQVASQGESLPDLEAWGPPFGGDNS